MPIEPTDENRAIARYIAGLFGGKTKVVSHDHDDLPLSIPILSAADRPMDGVVSYSTVGLSDHPNGDPDERRPRVEIVGACDARVSRFADVLATAGFCLMRGQWACDFWGVLRSAVRPYRLSNTMEHLFFAAPTVWHPGPSTLRLESKQVAWVLAVPISDAELDLVERRGGEALANELEAAGADLFNIERPSVV